MKMNTTEKIQFIRAYHAKLYNKLQAKLPKISDENWKPSEKDKADYNTILKEYCDKYSGRPLETQLAL